jgi:hypothetical protein
MVSIKFIVRTGSALYGDVLECFSEISPAQPPFERVLRSFYDSSIKFYAFIKLSKVLRSLKKTGRMSNYYFHLAAAINDKDMQLFCRLQ